MAISPLPDETDRDEVVAEINVTPLTDVFLVLLIIFMVTSTALVQAGLNVNLPRSRTATSQTQGVMISAAADGTLYVNEQPTTLAKLGKALRAAFGEGRQRVVTIRGDERIILRTLVQIMDISRRAGAEKIGVATRPPER
ncbi:MAG: ExbD/TolR family protein [Candidatus Methylomirabilia bacterium]